MDFPGYTTQSLERLSTDELIDLAENYGLDIPFGLERVFIIEELLYLDRRGIGNGITSEDEEQTMLLKQHNISIIEVLVRDPLWAFVFWEIKGHDQELYENDEDFDGYCLRVIHLNEDGSCGAAESKASETSPVSAEAASFTVAVGKNDSAWYLGFPPNEGSCYKVELCVPRLGGYTVLASSFPFRMPRLIESKRDGNEHTYDGEIQDLYQNPLALLSGIDSFTLLRNMDRPLRSRSL